MLKPAILYKNELTHLFNTIWFDKHYMYYNNSIYYKELKIDSESWNSHQFVSVDDHNEIIGFFSYNIDRQTNNVKNFHIINFSKNKMLFGLDLYFCLRDIFCKFNFHKLSFCCIQDNPAKMVYDKLVEKYKGRVIGVQKQEIKLMDNKYHDVVLYEILRMDYLHYRTMITVDGLSNYK